ncbi:subunit of TIM23 translocase complex [Thecaphora frezii]
MPPPPAQMQGVPQEQTVFQKMRMGAMMGTLVGLTIGFIGGGFQILRAGPGPKGTLATLSQFMLSSGATFGFFMSIGTVLRTDDAPIAAVPYNAASAEYVDRIKRLNAHHALVNQQWRIAARQSVQIERATR